MGHVHDIRVKMQLQNFTLPVCFNNALRIGAELRSVVLFGFSVMAGNSRRCFQERVRMINLDVESLDELPGSGS